MLVFTFFVYILFNFLAFLLSVETIYLSSIVNKFVWIKKWILESEKRRKENVREWKKKLN